MERTTVENLKELIRAGRAKTPATKVIKGGILVNVMSEEIYPADVAVYKAQLLQWEMWKTTLAKTQR